MVWEAFAVGFTDFDKTIFAVISNHLMLLNGAKAVMGRKAITLRN